ncbi:hypothetical protein RB653_005703 [Dictyostelium firmibasis]|uniref:ADP-ribosylation factor n=1 Tax=Dictyostelium firmibasis TaxID=79012 RepID=A0AAN7UA10_9MYCE
MLSELFNSLASFFSNIFSLFEGKKDTRILMIGLDGAGKSTLLYKLKLGDVVSTIPTIGFNVETIEYKNLSMTVWDVGGQNKIRALWQHYYHGSNAVIFVVDSTDRERIDEVREEIKNLLIQDELKDTQLLIFANKQDMNGAMNTAEIVNSLELNSIRDRKWYVQPCSAVRSDGIYEGFDWVANTLNKK